MSFIEYKKTEKISCVYQIYNKITKKSYIGSTVNLQDRLRRHYYALTHNLHHSQKLQRSFNKYNINTFEINILEQYTNIDKEDLANNELYYIKKLDTYNKGYNMIENCKLYSKFKLSASAIENRRKKSFKPVIALTLDGMFVKEYSSVSEAANDLNDQTTNISQACKSNTHSVKGFIFVYKINYNPKNVYKFEKKQMTADHISKIIEKAQHQKKCRIVNKVINNIVIKTFSSRRRCALEENLSEGMLRQALYKGLSINNVFYEYVDKTNIKR